MLRTKKERTPAGGIRRGLCVGLLVALAAGTAVIVGGYYVALPASFSGTEGCRWPYPVLLAGGAGYALACGVATASERAGGTASAVFDACAILSTAGVGIAVAVMVFVQARQLGYPAPSAWAVLVLVYIPCLFGAVIAVVRRNVLA
jgi:hypothetical protein